MMIRKLLDDCFLNDKVRLTHVQAIELLRERVSPVAGVTHVLVEDANGRFLAEQVIAERPIPAHDNAAVDGYAFSYSDYDPAKGSRLRVSARAAAGHPVGEDIEAETCARIFTGAVMPSSHDSVVMQEDVDIEMSPDGDWILIPAGLKNGANCRLAGEDVAQGATLFEPGMRLRPQDVAAIASTGCETVAVFERLKVAVFSTGDELVRCGKELGSGQVYDANSPMLKGLLESIGVDVVDLGILPDDKDVVRKCLIQASSQFHMVLTSGGASRGEEDYVVEAINDLGSLHMWQIAVKPGRPMAFGQIGDCAFAGLPGNPVAVFVCFLLYVRPLLARLSGGDWLEPNRFAVKAGFSLGTKKSGRREFWRGMLVKDDMGELTAQKYARDGSGLISSLREADGFIEVGEDVTEVLEGDMLDFIPFTEFGLSGR